MTTDIRKLKMLKHLNISTMRGLEIGALHSPAVPRNEGWNTWSVDHGTKEQLMAAYASDTNVSSELQDVDIVWNKGTLPDAIARSQIHFGGGIDFIIASHVIEHFPDFLGTLKDFSKILNNSGLVSLAVPDHRMCFDFFQTITSTADILTAYSEKRQLHSPASFFRMAAYNVHGIVNRGVSGELVSAKNIVFQSTLQHGYDRFLSATNNLNRSYEDNHTWYFTISSFTLIILELRAIGLIDFEVLTLESGPAGEFMVTLKKAPGAFEIDIDELNAIRMNLLKKIVVEQAERLEMLLKEQPY